MIIDTIAAAETAMPSCHERWRLFLFTLLLLLLPASAQQIAIADPHPAQLFTRVHPAMGTDFTLYIYAANATGADREAA